VPFYYGYYSSKWGRLGEGSLDSPDARDVLNWIKGGNDVSSDQASKPILPVNIHANNERRDRNKLLDESTLRDNQLTFGQKQYKMNGRPVSPKTNVESDTNFDEFINRLDRRRRMSQDSDREKSHTESRNGSRDLQTAGANKRGAGFRQKVLGNRNDESDILRFSTDRSVDNLKVSSGKKESGQTVLDDIFSARKDKRIASVERPREENSSASNRKKYQEDLFFNERLRNLDIGSEDIRPGIVKLKHKPKSSRTDSQADPSLEADDEKRVQSSRPMGQGAAKPASKRFAFSALNILKFSKALPLVLVRKAFLDLLKHDEEVRRARAKHKKMHAEVRLQEALHRLHPPLRNRSSSLLKAAFLAILAASQSRSSLAARFEPLQRVCRNHSSQSLRSAFSRLLGHSDQSHHATPFERLVCLLDQRRRNAGRRSTRQALADGLDSLRRTLMRKDMRCTHDIRRFLLRWRLAAGGGKQQASGLNKLFAFFAAKLKAHALKGFYCIQASGGRLDKLYIVANRKEKIYLAKLKYCFKKLRIWNKFRAGGIEAITNVRTIIIRTADPVDDQRNLNLTRMFKKKGLENLHKTFAAKRTSQLCAAFGLLRRALLRQRGTTGLLASLHGCLHRKRLQKAWVEINIFLLQKHSVESVTETLKGSMHFSPYSKKRDKTADKAVRKVKNPMFQFIQENRCNSDQKASSESLTLSHSNELEIFKTGLDLDTKLSQHFFSRLKTSSSSLEQILKSDERFGKSKVFLKFHRIRQLIVKLTSLYKKKLRISFARLGRAASTQKMSSLSQDYRHIGLSKLQQSFARQLQQRLASAFAALRPSSRRRG